MGERAVYLGRGGRLRILAPLQRRIDTLDRMTFRVELPLLVFIVIALPWEFTKTWFPTTLLEVSRLGTLVAVGFLGLHAINGTLAVPRSRIVIAIGAVVVLHVVSLGLHPTSNGLRDTAAIVIYACLCLFVAHVVSDRRRLAYLAGAIAVSATIVAAVAIAQELFHFYLWEAQGNDVLGRRNSTFGDPNIASRFLAVALSACLGILAARRGPSALRWALISLVVIIAIGDVLTLSRVGWILAALVIGAWILWLVVRRVASERWAAAGVAAFILAFGLYLVVNPATYHRAQLAAADAIARTDPDAADDVIVPPSQTPASLRDPTTPVDAIVLRLPLDSVRKSLIRAGIAMGLDQPIFGVGVGGYQAQILGRYWSFVPPDRRSQPTSLIHTDAVRVFAETGLIGVALWLAFLATGFLTAIRNARTSDPVRRVTAFAAGTALLVILIASQFAGRFFNEPYLWLVMGILIVVGDAVRWGALTIARPPETAPVIPR